MNKKGSGEMKLKPCKECGKMPVLFPPIECVDVWQIECADYSDWFCDAERVVAKSKSEAIKAWNTRNEGGKG